MEAAAKGVFRQPLIGVTTVGGALVLIAGAWIAGPASWSASESVAQVAVSLALATGVVLTFRFPIHIWRNTKIHMNSVPLYLMATQLAPPLAASAVGMAMLAGELSVARERRARLGTLATQVGRWVVVAFAGSLVAHVQVADTRFAPLPLAVAALVLFAGDILTAPLLFSPETGDMPLRVIRTMIREAGVPEGAQYLVGLLGALAVAGKPWALALLFLPTALVYLAFRSAREMRQGTREILESMADTVDLRDSNIGGHSRRVTELTAEVLREMNIQGPEADLIIAAARVHDIGKIGLPDHILKQDGMLTAEEKAIMQTHTDRAAELLMRYPDFARGAEIVRHHHEHWDGTGYPYRLKGRDIPLGARIIAVADGFDSMTSDRPHRRALTADQAASVLRDGRGTQWDPSVVDAFLRTIADRLEEPVAPMLRVVPTSEDAGTSVSA